MTLMARLTAVDAPAPLEAIQRDEEREDDGHQGHEERPGIGAAHDAGIEEADDVADRRCR